MFVNKINLNSMQVCIKWYKSLIVKDIYTNLNLIIRGNGAVVNSHWDKTLRPFVSLWVRLKWRLQFVRGASEQTFHTLFDSHDQIRNALSGMLKPTGIKNDTNNCYVICYIIVEQELMRNDSGQEFQSKKTR